MRKIAVILSEKFSKSNEEEDYTYIFYSEKPIACCLQRWSDNNPETLRKTISIQLHLNHLRINKLPDLLLVAQLNEKKIVQFMVVN